MTLFSTDKHGPDRDAAVSNDNDKLIGPQPALNTISTSYSVPSTDDASLAHIQMDNNQITVYDDNGDVTTLISRDNVQAIVQSMSGSIIQGAHIEPASITTEQITAKTLTADNIATGTITTDEIAAGTITAANIAAGTITTSELDAGAIDGMTITGATIRTGASGDRVIMDATGITGIDSVLGTTFRLPTDGSAPTFTGGIIKTKDITTGTRTLIVEVGDDIQTAIDALASTGGTVILRNGTHTQTSDINLKTSVYLQGENNGASIIDFVNYTYSIKANSSSFVSIGSVTVANNSTSVTGAGTSWLSAGISPGDNIFLGQSWYPIASVNSDTSITLILPYSGNPLSVAAYIVAIQPISDVFISNLTILNAATGISLTNVYNGEIDLVNIYTSTTGILMAACAGVTVTRTLLYSCNNSIYITNSGYNIIDNVGVVNSNIDGIDIISSSNSTIKTFYSINATRYGAYISNSSSINFDGHIVSSGSDGILVYGSSYINIYNSILDRNTGYGINIGVSSYTNLSTIQYNSNISGDISDGGTSTRNDRITVRSIGQSNILDTALGNLDDSIAAMAQTGFGGWLSGTDPSTYTLTGGKFQIDRTGYGYINGKKITWTSGQQTAALTANQLNYIYVDGSGTLLTTTTVATALAGIRLYEVLYDGTIYLPAKENHPYSANSVLSGYLHNNAGTVIRGIGCIPTRKAAGTGASTDDRQIKIVGADFLDDHGLTTTIADSAGAGVTWNTFYKNGSGKWIRYASQLELPIYFDNAGTPLALDVLTNVYAIYTLYVAKDDIEGTDNFIAVMPDAAYGTLAGALAVITAGTNTFATNELKALEAAQLGYAIVQYSATGGYINQITVAKSTFNNQLVGGAAGGSHNLLSGLDYASAGHTGFLASGTAIDTLGAATDITTLNASTTAHGLVVKATAPAAGLYNYVGITNGETAYTNKALFDATAPSTQAFADAAVVGSATVAARRDHKHAMMAAPTTITGNAGTATKTATPRAIWGQNFDGSAAISGAQTGLTTMTGGANNMTITAGTGASRTMALQTTTSGSTATTALTLNADQSATFANTVNATTFVGALTGTASGNLTASNSVAVTNKNMTDSTNTFSATVNNPTGAIIMFGASSAPTGWLLCDGSAVSRATYAALFTAISTTWGTGDGSTTFNLPDFRGIYPKGSGTTSRTAGKDALGNFYTSTIGAYTTDKLQGHRHNVVMNGGDGSGTDTINTYAAAFGSAGLASGGGAAYSQFHIGDARTGGNGTIRSGNTTEPQNVGVPFIIKT